MLTEQPVPDLIYLDAEPLRKGGWPQVGDRLRRLTQRTSLRRIPIRVPIAVFQELEAQFVRGARELQSEVLTFLRSISVPGEKPVIWPDDAAMLAWYQRASAAAINSLGIEVIPLPTRSIDDFLQDAIHAVSPFRRSSNVSDGGFKDAVIYWSVLENVAQSSPSHPIFISADRGYPDHLNNLRRVTIEEATELLGAPELPRGFLVVPGYMRASSFVFRNGDIQLRSDGADWSGVPALTHNPYVPGDPVSVNATFGGTHLGVGPAQVGGREWLRVHYAGHLELRGETVTAIANETTLSGPFSCHALLTLFDGSPMGSPNRLARVEVNGSGVASIVQSAIHDERFGWLLTALRVEYEFEEIALKEIPVD